VLTSNGEFKASKVVFATNAYASHLLPSLKGLIVPTRGQVISTVPMREVFPFSFSVDDGEYMMQRKCDGRIVLGGFRRSVEGIRCRNCSVFSFLGEEKNIEDDSVCNPKIHENLVQFLGDLGVSPDKVEYEWTGIMGFSVDGYPIVGEFEKNAYIGMFAFCSAALVLC
jgi:glycine/D-amino acid oxidase-like deaminating enzyme